MEKQTTIRISDFQSVIPAITGKVELVYEGEHEARPSLLKKLDRKRPFQPVSQLFPWPW